jgi:hypothetical protein
MFDFKLNKLIQCLLDTKDFKKFKLKSNEISHEISFIIILLHIHTRARAFVFSHIYHSLFEHLI